MCTISKSKYIERRQALSFLAVTPLILLFTSVGLAQVCSPVEVSKLKSTCTAILNDVASTLNTGEIKLEAAKAKFIESAEPAFKCTTGGYELLQAAFTTCNPLSPAVNPLLCARSLLDIPDTITSCQQTVSLLSESQGLLSEANYIFGIAAVAFPDQGGDEIAEKLENCGNRRCVELSQLITKFAQARAGFSDEQKGKLTTYYDKILLRKTELVQCLKTSESCSFGIEIERPEFENTQDQIPGIILD